VSRQERRYQFHSFYHAHACRMLEQIRRGGVDAIYDRVPTIPSIPFLRTLAADPFEARYGPTELVARPLPREAIEYDFLSAWQIYHWELSVIIPLFISRALMRNLRFDAALRVLERVFDPSDNSEEPRPERFWRPQPFFEATRADYEEQQAASIFKAVAEGGDLGTRKQVEQFLANPFDAYTIARLRPTAFQKAIVMQRLDILIAAADHYMRSDRPELLDLARERLMQAKAILGRKPMAIPPRAFEPCRRSIPTIRWARRASSAISSSLLKPSCLLRLTRW
jgi:hypothetical protein